MPSTTATIKHRTQITGTNNTGVQISKNPWNDSELVAGGSTGGLMVRDSGQTDGFGLVDAVAAGQVLTSAGTSTLPAWSSTLTLGTTPASAGQIRLPYNTSVLWRNSGNTADTGFTFAGSLTLKLDPGGFGFIPDVDANHLFGGPSSRWHSGYFSSNLNIGTNPASAGDLRLAASGAINRRNNANGADLGLITRVTTDEVAFGDAGANTRVRSVMAQPTSLANGDWWLESNTGAVTGASGALMSRLNGATVLVSPSIRAKGRATAQTAANASVSTFTNGSADASYEVSANVLVTTATSHAFTVTCAYTDEGNTARTLTLAFTLVAGGTLVTSVANANGAVPYMGIPQHIRCKASTAITVATAGTFTTVTYNVEGIIRQVA